MKQLTPAGVQTPETDERPELKQKDAPYGASLYLLLGFGGPSSIFSEHLSTDKLIEDMILLYFRLVDLNMGYCNGAVSLVELEEALKLIPARR